MLKIISRSACQLSTMAWNTNKASCPSEAEAVSPAPRTLISLKELVIRSITATDMIPPPSQMAGHQRLHLVLEGYPSVASKIYMLLHPNERGARHHAPRP